MSKKSMDLNNQRKKLPTFFRGRAIIQPGGIYEIDGVDFEVITATAKILEDSVDGIALTETVFYLRNLETDEIVYMSEKALQEKFKTHFMDNAKNG